MVWGGGWVGVCPLSPPLGSSSQTRGGREGLPTVAPARAPLARQGGAGSCARAEQPVGHDRPPPTHTHPRPERGAPAANLPAACGGSRAGYGGERLDSSANPGRPLTSESGRPAAEPQQQQQPPLRAQGAAAPRSHSAHADPATPAPLPAGRWKEKGCKSPFGPSGGELRQENSPFRFFFFFFFGSPSPLPPPVLSLQVAGSFHPPLPAPCPVRRGRGAGPGLSAPPFPSFRSALRPAAD